MKTISTVAALLAIALALPLPIAAEEVQLETDSVSKDYENELPKIPPTAASQSLSKFKIADGFRIELAAHEPVVTDPISMAFDEMGRLFVVCMHGYSENAEDNLGVVRLLQDKDHDGHFETGSDFLKGLAWPTAVACYDGGVFIAAAPDILYCKDTNGDGVADEKRIVFTGFARNNVQGMLNSFRWGLDNRLYGASGLNGGKISSRGGTSNGTTIENDSVITLRGRDFSIDPASMSLRPEAGGAQHGATFDRWGERFVCSNSDHLQWVEFEDRHLRRNPLLQGYRARKSIAVDGAAAEVYRTSAVEPWRIVRTRLRVKGIVGGPVEGGGRASGYFTSASGLTAYTGDALTDYQDGDYFFVGDVGSNLVHLKQVKTKGLNKTAERTNDRKTEFITSTDNWFRPVQFANGPDGSLYVLDMYRETIEHPLSLPPMIKKHVDLTSGRDRGRIYRIASDSKQLPHHDLPGNANAEALVAMLGHANGWHRETAARLILTRCSKSEQSVETFAPLLLSAVSEKSPHARIRAMYCLQSLNLLSAPTLVARLGDEHPQVRRHALKILESTQHFDKVTASQLERLATDEDEQIRYQLAITLGAFPPDQRRQLLCKIASKSSNDRKLQFAVLSSMNEDRVGMLRQLCSIDAANHDPLIEEITRQIGQSLKDISEAIELLSLQGEPQRFRHTMSLLDGTGKRGKPLIDWLSSHAVRNPNSLIRELQSFASQRATDPSLSQDERLFMIRKLGLFEFAQVAHTFGNLLSLSQSASVQNAAVEELGKFNSIDAGKQLIAVVDQLNPVARRKATELLISRTNWARQLLQSIANGETRATQLSATNRDKLLRHRDADVAKLAKEHFKTVPDRAGVIAKYQSVLTRGGDSTRGRTLFRKVCSSCHLLEGIGTNVGPDLAPLRNRGAAFMLTNILDPNREVDPRYESYTIVTTDGRSLSGILVNDSSSTTELKQADGTIVTIPKNDIEHLQATGLSLMPEGLESDLGEQGIADVIAWLVRSKPER